MKTFKQSHYSLAIRKGNIIDSDITQDIVGVINLMLFNVNRKFILFFTRNGERTPRYVADEVIMQLPCINVYVAT